MKSIYNYFLNLKNNLFPSIYFVLFLLVITSCNKSYEQKTLRSAEGCELKMPYAKMALSAKFIGTAIEQEDWFNWCVSPIIGKDGKVHIFSSRWPKTDGMEGWSGNNAEIAHFIGETPEGPFTFVKTVLNSKMFCDSTTMSAPHNPRLEFVDGKYVLLYICQNPSKPSMQSRIGMITSSDINGPWTFEGEEGIVVEISPDSAHWTSKATIGVCNPAFLKIKDRYYIYFSCPVKPHDEASCSYGYAVSDKIGGPYKLCDSPITDNLSYIEDAQAFNYKDSYYLLTTDNYGRNTGLYGSLILWKSKDGLSYKMKDAKIALGTSFDYWNDDSAKVKLLKTPNLFIRSTSGKLERPAILKINGIPSYLYAVGGVNLEGGSLSKSYIYKIDWNDGM